MKNNILLSLVSFAALAGSGASLAVEAPSGKALYETYCTQCHGTVGDGWGLNSRDITVLPRDHTETSEMAARTDEDLFKAVKHGGAAVNKSVLMPNWDANMTDEEIHRVVDYLRELCQCSSD